MQPVVDLTCPPKKQLYNILVIITLSIIMIQLRKTIEQSMLMRYNTCWENNISMVLRDWIQPFEGSIQVEYGKIDKYTPRDWKMYNEGKVSGYTDGYNQGLLEGHDIAWDEAKEYYQKIFERELTEAMQQWKGENANFEEITEEYEESEVEDEWSSNGYNRDSRQTESWEWFED
jgi:hypothetical protein